MDEPEQVTKKCTKCGETKPFIDYYADKKTATGRAASCKDCKNKINKTYKGRNKTRRKNEPARRKSWGNRAADLLDLKDSDY